MVILTLTDFLGMIKPIYNEHAQVNLALKELRKDSEEVQLESIEDVYIFSNGAVVAIVEPSCDPEFKILDKETASYDEYVWFGKNTQYDLNGIELDVFPHE